MLTNAPQKSNLYLAIWPNLQAEGTEKRESAKKQTPV